jgi:hypothetical protein
MGLWDGDIHNHAWDVSSYNIKGYKDVMVRCSTPQSIDIPPEEFEARGLCWIFRPAYKEKDSVDMLTCTGLYTQAYLHRTRDDIGTADFHTIKHYDFHAPIIDENTFASTLVINSHRVRRPLEWGAKDETWDADASWPDILIQGTSEPIVGARRAATLHDKLYAKAQLVETLIDKPYNFLLQGVLAATRERLADMNQDVSRTIA